ncbi:MAG: hypothetical protein ACOYJB_04800 [Christensenellaceae bacterium]|jgi:hypothetical protein
MQIIQIALIALFLVSAVHLVLFSAKNLRIPVLEDEQAPFTVRYPRAFLVAAVIYFLAIGGFVLMFVLQQSADVIAIVLLCVLGFVGLMFLLLFAVFRIKVFQEDMIYINMFNIKRRVYFKDIREAVVTRYGITLISDLRTYRFFAYVTYREDFLRRLAANGVKISRFNR